MDNSKISEESLITIANKLAKINAKHLRKNELYCFNQKRTPRKDEEMLKKIIYNALFDRFDKFLFCKSVLN